MKTFIRILLIFALFLGVSMTSSAQIKQTVYQPTQEIYVYRDLGTFVAKFPDGSSIGIHAYILKSSNDTGNYEQYNNVFTLVAESTSLYGGYYRPTWLYETRVFVNGVEASSTQYPVGFTAYVKTTPTIIYYWYTNDDYITNYYFSWNSSAYEIK
jgi:hypothetical protein